VVKNEPEEGMSSSVPSATRSSAKPARASTSRTAGTMPGRLWARSDCLPWALEGKITSRAKFSRNPKIENDLKGRGVFRTREIAVSLLTGHIPSRWDPSPRR
jgi:hypothetical protein